jgi:hypothetical protein
MTTQVQPSGKNAKQVVLELGNAINAEDFQLARKYVSDNLKHIFPLGTHDNAEVYFQQLEQIRPKFDIHKTFVEPLPAPRNDDTAAKEWERLRG